MQQFRHVKKLTENKGWRSEICIPKLHNSLIFDKGNIFNIFIALNGNNTKEIKRCI